MATKKPTAKQLAARKKFVAAVKAGKFKKKIAAAKKSTTKKAPAKIDAMKAALKKAGYSVKKSK